MLNNLYKEIPTSELYDIQEGLVRTLRQPLTDDNKQIINSILTNIDHELKRRAPHVVAETRPSVSV